MKTPDVTPVQAIGAALMVLLAALWPVLDAFGVGLTTVQVVAVSAFVTQFVAFAVVADAVIRNGRARVAAAAVTAGAVKIPVKTTVSRKK